MMMMAMSVVVGVMVIRILTIVILTKMVKISIMITEVPIDSKKVNINNKDC